MSKSKEDILKEAYESTFTSPKYEKSNLQHTYENVVKPAMDEYAKQVSIEFADHLNEGGWHPKGSDTSKWCKISGSTQVTVSVVELFQLFLKYQSKDKTGKK